MMKKKIILPAFLISLLIAESFGQRYVDVAPDVSGSIGALNIAISGDTTSTGERVDPGNTIYRLQRGATYFTNLSVINTGFPLTIEAAQGEGERPRIVPGLTLEGTSDVPFRPVDDFTLRGVYLTARTQGAGLEDQMVRVQSDGVRVVIDDCFFDQSSQSAVRTDTRATSIFITNSIVALMGTPDDIDNGRVVDDRGNFIDTLVMENNTIYNITSRVVRDGSGADSYINYVRFNQNTVANVGQRMADFGPVINFTFTNNIIINPAFNGVGVDPDPFNPSSPDPNATRATAAIVLDSVAQSILDAAGVTQTADIRNNNIYFTPGVLEARPVTDPDPDDEDVIASRPNFSLTAEAFIEANGTADTMIEEVLEFSNQPEDPALFIQEFWQNFDGSITLSPWVTENAPYSFSYSTDAISATASTVNLQLGDPNWPLISSIRNELEELLEEANIFLENNQIGNNIGDISQSAADSLLNAVAFAQQVVDDPTSTQEEIEDALLGLQGAIDFFLNGLITSVEEAAGSLLDIYPNPAVEAVTIISDKELDRIEMRDISGMFFDSLPARGKELRVEVLDRPAGLYILSIFLRDGTQFNHRIIIE